MNIYQQLVEHFGGQQKAASALGVTQPALSSWVNRRWSMSPIVALRAERLTDGKFKAQDLCPALREAATP